MAGTLTDHAAEHRYELAIDGELAAIIEHSLRPGSIALNHTETRPGFEGQGVAGRLVRHALADARASGLAVSPFCPYGASPTTWVPRRSRATTGSAAVHIPTPDSPRHPASPTHAPPASP